MKLQHFFPLLLIVISEQAISGTFTWTGSVNGNWNNVSNWTPAIPLSASDTALVFDSAAVPATTNDLTDLTLNSLSMGENSGVRTLNGNSLTFDGTAPSISMVNISGTGNTIINTPIIAKQTLSLIGGVNFDNQLILSPTAIVSGNGGIRNISGLNNLNAPNTYLGATVIEGGLLGVSSSGGFGNSSSVTIENGGSLQLTGSVPTTFDKPLTLQGTGSPGLSNYALAAARGGAKSWTGSILLAGDATILSILNTSFTLSGTETLELNGHDLKLTTGSDLQNAITISKTVTGSGNLLIFPHPASAGVSLQAANTFTGGITLSSGILSITGNDNFGNSENVLTINGGTLSAAGNSSLTIPASREIIVGSAGATFQGLSSYNQIFTIETGLTGSGPVGVKKRVAFSSANTFEGPVTISAEGTLSISSDSSLGAATNTVNLAGDSSTTATLVISAGAELAETRNIVITGASGTVETHESTTLNVPISGPGQLILSPSDDLALVKTNTHQGGTSIVSGKVRIHNDSALGAPDQPLTMSGSSTLTASQPLVLPASRTLRFYGGGPSIDTTGADIHILGNMESVEGNGSFNKTGSGVLRFDGTSSVTSYIEEGTLSGTGDFLDLLIFQDGTFVSPGDDSTIGTIQCDMLSNSGRCDFTINVTTGSSDRLSVASNIYAQGEFHLKIRPVGPIAVSDTFMIFEKTSAGFYNMTIISEGGDYLYTGLTFVSGGVLWRVNCEAGDGNDISITALSGDDAPIKTPTLSNFVISPADPDNPDSYTIFSANVSNGYPNTSLILESSTDLGDLDPWETMDTIYLDENGEATLTDIYDFETSPKRRNFYRLRMR